MITQIIVMQKKDIKDLTLQELKKEISDLGAPSYRAPQVFRWIYKQGVSDFDGMKNIPNALKDKLKTSFIINKLKRSSVNR